ncbi:hypothetical protein CTI14_49200 [Methylobacterium radiotolerans]|nr:hypothetical protein CTI14_49200 [Methylobacterium radiotolerans]
MGYIDASGVSLTLPDGRPLLDEVSFRVGAGSTSTRAIVLAHGGSMDVTSAEGVGTEFRFFLPAAPKTEVLQTLSRAD